MVLSPSHISIHIGRVTRLSAIITVKCYPHKIELVFLIVATKMAVIMVMKFMTVVMAAMVMIMV